MAEDLHTYLSELASEVKGYMDLTADELKLKTTKALSAALGHTLAYLLIFVVLSIVLGLLSFAGLQGLNSLLGAPWGTLIVAGVLTVLLAVLWSNRKRLFRDMFVKLFIDVFYDNNGN